MKRIFTPQERKNQNSNKYIGRKKKYRKANKAMRNKSRSNNYCFSRIVEKAPRRPTGIPHRPWTEDEIYHVLNASKLTDLALSIWIHRSVQAIQQKRYQIRKAQNENIQAKN